MGMTDEEKFRFDLTGFLVRPAILETEEIAAIVEQIDRIKHDAESLPPSHRSVPGGPSSLLIDHPNYRAFQSLQGEVRDELIRDLE